jgi:uncharacterized repeat protein (TIGR04042 family)
MMPEMRFVVRWPDEKISSCYSPSLVVKDYLAEGTSYPLPEFMERCRTALTIASDRVKAKYGFHCTGASSQLEELEQIASRFEPTPQSRITVVRFE